MKILSHVIQDLILGYAFESRIVVYLINNTLFWDELTMSIPTSEMEYKYELKTKYTADFQYREGDDPKIFSIDYQNKTVYIQQLVQRGLFETRRTLFNSVNFYTKQILRLPEMIQTRQNFRIPRQPLWTSNYTPSRSKNVPRGMIVCRGDTGDHGYTDIDEEPEKVRTIEWFNFDTKEWSEISPGVNNLKLFRKIGKGDIFQIGNARLYFFDSYSNTDLYSTSITSINNNMELSPIRFESKIQDYKRPWYFGYMENNIYIHAHENVLLKYRINSVKTQSANSIHGFPLNDKISIRGDAILFPMNEQLCCLDFQQIDFNTCYPRLTRINLDNGNVIKISLPNKIKSNYLNYAIF